VRAHRHQLGPVAALALTSAAAGQGPEWSTFAAGMDRNSLAETPPTQISAARFVVSLDELLRPITFDGQSGPVTAGEWVYVLGRSGGQSRLYCANAVTGVVRWSAPVPAPVLESWASPTIDEGNGTVLVASGRFLTAIHAVSGAPAWQAELDLNTAGACAAVTTDLGDRDRAFITDYDGFGGSGRLYCISVDPMSPANPYQPGQVVWSVTLGTTGANTPAYSQGVVYVASVSDTSTSSPGLIRSFDAAAPAAPPPLWAFTNTASEGFFGGVSVTNGAVYAASYAFAGGQFAGNLVKLDAATGLMHWSIACNRTDAIPVVLPDDDVLVSGGIRGFGCVPSVQKFRDNGTSATLLWDSALDSWVDANNNQQMDPGEYVDVGGWTVQPALSSRAGTPVLFAGVLPEGSTTATACATLMELDPARMPSDPQFIRASFTGAGSSPAVASRGLYTLGPAGLHALGTPPCVANCDRSTGAPVLTGNDFLCFLNLFTSGDARANCDESTADPMLSANDFLCFVNKFAAGCA
jgi:outer membrane protein assembly factor BamB